MGTVELTGLEMMLSSACGRACNLGGSLAGLQAHAVTAGRSLAGLQARAVSAGRGLACLQARAVSASGGLAGRRLRGPGEVVCGPSAAKQGAPAW